MAKVKAAQALGYCCPSGFSLSTFTFCLLSGLACRVDDAGDDRIERILIKRGSGNVSGPDGRAAADFAGGHGPLLEAETAVLAAHRVEQDLGFVRERFVADRPHLAVAVEHARLLQAAILVDAAPVHKDDLILVSGNETPFRGEGWAGCQQQRRKYLFHCFHGRFPFSKICFRTAFVA